MSFEMKLIPEELSMEKRWKVHCKYDTSGNVSFLQVCSRYGELIYGLRPENYAGLAFYPCDGVIVLPYVIPPNGEFLVGLILEKRPNMGDEPVWCGIGGYRDPGEAPCEAAIREFVEETGFGGVIELEDLCGPSMNTDRSIYVVDHKKGEGVHAFCVRILDGEVEEKDGSIKFKDSILVPGFQKTNKVCFFSWGEAILIVADSLALGALAKFKKTIG